MGEFSYTNIFATKGIEYLFVLFYLVLLVFFWRILHKSKHSMKKKSTRSVTQFLTNKWFNLPDDYYYHPGHSWAFPETRSVVKVGIDDFAQKLIGTPDLVELPEIGSSLEQGGKGWNFIIDSKDISMISPVNGEVIEINKDILENPELINEEPFENGWIMKVKVPNLKTNLKNLVSKNTAISFLNNKIDKINNLSPELGVVLQDGGVPVSGFAKKLSPVDWEKIANEFLLNT